MSILDLLFVPHCPACDARLPSTHGPLCDECSISLYEIGPACPRCALPASGPDSVICARCLRRPPPYASARAAFRYGGELAAALRRLKYGGRPDIARILAPLLAPALALAAREADVAMPVPLHWRRLSRRGYNQAALLLAHASRGTGLDIDALSLRRRIATAPQSELPARHRKANVANAFAVVPRRRERVVGRRVLLCDDVMTTGATLASAARSLRQAGARSVLVFSAARAEIE